MADVLETILGIRSRDPAAGRRRVGERPRVGALFAQRPLVVFSPFNMSIF